MRIGIDITSALTQGGGIGRYTRELIHALVETDFHNRFDISFFSAKIDRPPPVPNPIPTHPQVHYTPAILSEKWLYRLWYRLRQPIPVQLFTGQLDLFHSPDFVLPPVWGDIPTLLTVHDLSFVHYPHVFTPTLVNYLNRVVPWSVKRATHILADSAATKRDLIDIWQVPQEKITVLYSGVHPRFRPVEDKTEFQAVRAKYNLGEAPYLIAVGTIQPRKNYQMLIKAFKAVAQYKPHNLVIAGGKGWLFDEIYAEVERQGLQDRVIFTGFVDDADLPTLYSMASLLTFPSLYEGFGLPLLEAMACGLPIINSNSSCLPEVAGNATLQLQPEKMADWQQGIITLLDDPTRRTQMIAAGFEQVEKFSWATSAETLLGIYRKLLVA